MKRNIGILGLLFLMFALGGCVKEDPFVVRTYEVTDPEKDEEDQPWITLATYYEMSDGTWKTDTHTYQYRLEISGRMNDAAKDTTFVFLSNQKEITFEQAWKASGLSSDMDDYFEEEVAKFVGWAGDVTDYEAESQKPAADGQTESESAAAMFQAVVLEAADGHLLVEPVGGSFERNASDKISIPNQEDIKLKAGDTIEVTYDGNLMETYPAQLGAVYQIALVHPEEAKDTWDIVPLVRVNDKLYYDTGKESTLGKRCGNMDGEIRSEVEGSQIPTENDQSNFGSGFGYQYGADDTIEVRINGKWMIFEHREE